MTALLSRVPGVGLDRDGAAGERARWFLTYAIVMAGGLMIAVVARGRVTTPYLAAGLGLMLLLVTTWLIRPRATLYLTVFLTAIADIVTVWWFPFVKNFSSRESITFVSDALTISPLDITLGVGFVVVIMQHFAHHRRFFAPSELIRPIIVFTAFVTFGFARGLGSGGDLRIAVLEGRSLFYLLLVYGIAINVCTEWRHYRHLLWWLLGGVFVQSLLSLEYLLRLDQATRDTLESLNEHGSALGHNLLLITLLAIVLLRARAAGARILLMAAMIPTVVVYFVAERRAGVATLAVAGVVLLLILRWRRPRRFWVIAPVLVIMSIGYLGAFWNSTSSLAFPAQAVKTVVSPGSASEKDQSSDLYRLVEANNLNLTIRTDPLLGRGFGQPFFRFIDLPGITEFDLNRYVPHNSLLWFWIKTGFLGFATMFYVFGKAMMLGAHRVRRMPDGVDVVTATSSLLFLVMYLMYTFVDLSWDARNMVFVGVACAVCTSRATAPEVSSDPAHGGERDPAPLDGRRQSGVRDGDIEATAAATASA